MSTKADGIVKGVLNNFRGIEASVKALVSCCCCHNKPIGCIEGTIQFPTDGILQRYKFCSGCPTFVKTSRECHFKKVVANFIEVTLINLDSEVEIKNCKAFLTASQSKPNCWWGSLVIETPCCQKIEVIGNFAGNVTVKHSVKCSKKKWC